MAVGIRRLLGLVIVVVLVMPVLAPACASNQDGTNLSPPTQQAEEKGEPLPPLVDEQKDWPEKLSSALWQLIEAERRGEAELLARQGNIELVDESVEVTIECMPG